MLSPSTRARMFCRSLSSGTRLHLYRISAVCDGGKPLCRSTTSTGHVLATDVPRAAGGGDSFAQPVETLLASLLGCKAATAHYVARQLWPRLHNRIERIEFAEVEAARDERGALHLPIDEEAPVTSSLLCCPLPPILTPRCNKFVEYRYVSGIAKVRPFSAAIEQTHVLALGALVERRCPVAGMMAQAGVRMQFRWLLDSSV